MLYQAPFNKKDQKGSFHVEFFLIMLQKQVDQNEDQVSKYWLLVESKMCKIISCIKTEIPVAQLWPYKPKSIYHVVMKTFKGIAER